MKKYIRGVQMFTIILLLINITISGLGIYLFDYKIDSIINSPLVIILSIVVGTTVMIISAALYIEGFYHFVAKRKPINSKLKHLIAKQFMGVPIHAMNIRIKVVGKENLPENPGFSIYSNHTSMMDIPVLMYALKDYPVAFLAKQMVADLPFIGKWTEPLGCVMIDRTSSRKGAQSIIQVIKHVKNGSSMVVFPEGTRSYKAEELNEFKHGAFKVALKSKAPLVPLSIVKANNYRLIKWPFVKRITIVIHKPLEYSKYKEINSIDLSNKVKTIIESEL